jgi:rubrerythrin
MPAAEPRGKKTKEVSMGVFNASDVYEIAMRIEENGSNFYRYAAQLTKDEEAKKTFEWLAGEEEKHKATFSDLLSKIERHDPPESYPGEYGSYLHDYADNNLIFKKEVMEAEMAEVNDTLSAVDFAIRRELDSILYYHEIKGFINKTQHESIEKIINEERNHFEILSKLKKNVC